MEETDEIDNLHLQHITTHPNYLHSNSTSHKWVFGAIAELIGTKMNVYIVIIIVIFVVFKAITYFQIMQLMQRHQDSTSWLSQM